LPHARAGPKKGLGPERAQLIARVRFVAFRDAERAWGKLVALYKTVLA
jgi:hypothetical protein